MAALHIAFCTDGIFPLATGGMQRHSRLLAEHLAGMEGIRLTVFHPHELGQFSPALGIREVQVQGIDPRRFYLRELWQYSGRMAHCLRAEMEKPGGPEVIFAQGFSLWKGIAQFSDRVVVHPHGLEMFQGLSLKERLLGWPFRQLVRHVARRSAMVVSLGGKLTPILENLVAGTQAKVVVLPNAVDVPANAAEYPPDERPLRLLFVGRFAFNKGIDVLMEVADRIASEGLANTVRFDLAGGGPLLAQYQKAGLPENIRLLGRVKDDELVRLYGQCHGFVLPTRFEGMPTVVLEAMAHARPVLVSNVGASAELVITGKNGFLLPPGDADALHQAVRQFMAAGWAERREMGHSGYRIAKEKFAWPAVAAKHAEVLRNLRDGISEVRASGRTD